MAPAVLDDRVQILGSDGPSRRIARAVEEHQPGAGTDVLGEPLDVERPAVAGRAEGVVDHDGAADAQRLTDIGPDRADHDGTVARVDERLGDQSQGLHARGRDRDAPGVDVDVVDAPVVGADLVAQFRLAAVGLVEVIPVTQRPPGGLDGDVRAWPATLPEPQGNHAGLVAAGLGDVADEARREFGGPPARGVAGGGLSHVHTTGASLTPSPAHTTHTHSQNPCVSRFGSRPPSIAQRALRAL